MKDVFYSALGIIAVAGWLLYEFWYIWIFFIICGIILWSIYYIRKDKQLLDTLSAKLGKNVQVNSLKNVDEFVDFFIKSVRQRILQNGEKYDTLVER